MTKMIQFLSIIAVLCLADCNATSETQPQSSLESDLKEESVMKQVAKTTDPTDAQKRHALESNSSVYIAVENENEEEVSNPTITNLSSNQSDDPALNGQQQLSLETSEEEIVVSESTKNVGLLRVGMTVDEIESFQLPFSKRTISIEGDDYTIYDVNITNESVVECMFDFENKVYSFATFSKEIKDEFGNGVGSSLNDLRKSYPDGRLILGTSDGKFFNFLTGTPLIFSMDKDLVPHYCFEIGVKCENIGKCKS